MLGLRIGGNRCLPKNCSFGSRYLFRHFSRTMKERCAFRYQYYYRMFIVKESVIKIIDLTDSQLFFFVCFLNRTVYTSYVLGRAKVIILMKKKTQSYHHV